MAEVVGFAVADVVSLLAVAVVLDVGEVGDAAVCAASAVPGGAATPLHPPPSAAAALPPPSAPLYNLHSHQGVP